MNRFEIGLTVLAAGCCVVDAVTAPQMFIPSFVAGAIVGSIISIATKNFRGNEASFWTNVEKKLIEERKSSNYLVRNLCQTALYLGGAAFNGAVFVANLTHHAVGPILSFASKGLAVGAGFSSGVCVGFLATNKIIYLIDAHNAPSPILV